MAGQGNGRGQRWCGADLVALSDAGELGVGVAGVAGLQEALYGVYHLAARAFPDLQGQLGYAADVFSLGVMLW